MRKGVFTFDRADLIGTKLLLLLIVIGVGAYAVVSPVIDWIRDRPYRAVVAGPEGMGVTFSGLEVKPGAKVLPSGEIEAVLQHPSSGLRLLDLGSGLVLFLGVLVVAWLVHRLLSRIVSGGPFTRESVWGLRAIALVLLVGPWIQLPLVLARNGSTTAQALDTGGATFLITISSGLLWLSVLGLVVAAIAEAFARGVQLQDDQEGLV
jgi:hypothetical protein